MKRYIALKYQLLSLFTIISMLLTAQVSAQINAPLNYSTHFSPNSARLMPSKLGMDDKKIHINLLHTYAYFGNSGMNYGDFLDIWNSPLEEKQSEIRRVADEMDDINMIGMGVMMQPLSLAVKIAPGDKELFTFSFDASVQAGFALEHGKNFLLLLNGTKQFAGEEVNLGPFALHAVTTNEYALGGSIPIDIEAGPLRGLRAGARFRFIRSSFNIYTEKGDALMYVSEDGRYIDFDFDYRYNTAMPDYEENGDNIATAASNPYTDPLGRGFGIDLGVTANLLDNIQVSAGVVNIGGIRYTQDVKNYENRAQTRFEGVEVRLISREADDPMETDFNEEILQPNITEDDYRMPLGAQFVLQGEYGLNEIFEENNFRLFRHNFYLTYVQGFNNLITTTTRPYVALAYGMNVGQTLNFGVSGGYGGFNQLSLGCFFSVRAGAFRIGVGTSNITGLIVPRRVTGIDGTFNLAFAF